MPTGLAFILAFTVSLTVSLTVAGCASHRDADRDGRDPAPTGGERSEVSSPPGSGGAGAVGGEPLEPTLPVSGNTVTAPSELTRYVTGNDADSVVQGAKGGLILMGGGSDVDEAFVWMAAQLGAAERSARGGDAVILRASGADGYNDYLYDEVLPPTLGGFDSVETLIVDSRELANEPYVAQRLANAEAIFIAGGDQWVYLSTWTGTSVDAELKAAVARGAVLGGTSAGTAVIGEFVFDAEQGSAYSDDVLVDPYNATVSLTTGFLSVPILSGAITDTHFAERDRMGRLLGFVARLEADGLVAAPYGLGIDEATAVVIDSDGNGKVVGDGAAYVLRRGNGEVVACAPGEALKLTNFELKRLDSGEEVAFPVLGGAAGSSVLSCAEGDLAPSDPY